MIKWRRTLRPKLILFFVAAVVAGLTSCRTARDLSSARLKPISAEKLLDNARKQAFEFEDLSIRRINVQFSNEETRTSFRATLKASRNEKILASVSKLNIPVARVLLSSDEVTFVNYIDRNYFIGDYSYLSNILNFDVSFDVVQAVLANPVKTSLDEHDFDHRNFETTIEAGRYVLQPVNRTRKLLSAQRIFQGRTDQNVGYAAIGNMEIKKLMFNPDSFVLEKMVMEDQSDERRLEVDFNDFEKVEGYDYPGSIDVKMFNGTDLTELNIRLRGFSTEKVNDTELNVPDSYQRINIR